jgi:hypothetical protein
MTTSTKGTALVTGAFSGISGNSLETSADETLCHRWRDRHDISATRLSSVRSARSSTVAPPR